MADLIERDALLQDMTHRGGLGIGGWHVFDVINEQPAVNRWIPCSERLPNEAGKYIVCGRWHGEKPKTWICQFIIFGDIGGFANHAKNPPISFWMPLPEPPKE